MSAEQDIEVDVSSSCCASCGTAGNDDVTLRKCTACYSARYCSVKCQREHWPKHKSACKKRAAELAAEFDELLFKQPESSHYGDCPICCLPLSIDPEKTSIWPCCSKVICDGCDYANWMRELEMKLESKCPFCRHPLPELKAECDRNERKRAEANDPGALRQLGVKFRKGGDYKGAFECWTKAVELGSVSAHYDLSVMYHLGAGVKKDEKKEVRHLEKAAIGGHPEARNNLGVIEMENGRYKRAIKHFIIAAKLGHSGSLDALKDMYQEGTANKEDFSAALRAYQAAVSATKSPQREVAEEYRRNNPDV